MTHILIAKGDYVLHLYLFNRKSLCFCKSATSHFAMEAEFAVVNNNFPFVFCLILHLCIMVLTHNTLCSDYIKYF